MFLGKERATIARPTATSSRGLSLARGGLSVVLGVSGCALVWAAVSLRGDDPTSINDPIAVVLGATGLAAITLATVALTMVMRPTPPTQGMASVAVWSASAAIAAYVVLFLWPLGKNVGGDHSVETIGLILPVLAATLAVTALIAAVVAGRGVRIAAVVATVVMAGTASLVPVWLWAAHCTLYQSLC